MRGEFKRGDGLRIPNNLTAHAAELVLSMALRNVDSYDLYAGLCRGAPDPMLDLNQLTEPTIGVNGYSRILIPRGDNGWPKAGRLADEPYIESMPLVWNALGTGFDVSIDRVFLTIHESEPNGNVFALSSRMPTSVRLKPETALAQRSFTYTLFLR